MIHPLLTSLVLSPSDSTRYNVPGFSFSDKAIVVFEKHDIFNMGLAKILKDAS